MLCWVVTKQESNQKLVNVLYTRLQEKISKRKIKEILDQRGAIIDGQICQHASAIVKKRQKIVFYNLLQENFSVDWSKRVIDQDDDFFVVDKPLGVISDSSETLFSVRKLFAEALPCHRLDKDTTGVWLWAKNEEAEKAMQDLFRNRLVSKNYFCIANGVPKQNKGVCSLPILCIRGKRGNHRWVADKKGRPAETFWNVQKRGKKSCLFKCCPTTGRTHQIRIHMKEQGYPILGDYRYQRQFSSEIYPPRCMLHAESIEFAHPFTGKDWKIQSPFPKDFIDILEKI